MWECLEVNVLTGGYRVTSHRGKSQAEKYAQSVRTEVNRASVSFTHNHGNDLTEVYLEDDLLC
jgi:hypothetical protein